MKISQIVDVLRRGEYRDVPLAMDAIMGSIWEEKWRGSFNEYESNYGLDKPIKCAIDRLLELGDIDISVECPKPKRVKEIGLGTYGWKYDPAIITEACLRGIDWIDTAETYGYGRTEWAIGSISELDNIKIATKVSRQHLAPQSIRNAFNRSLNRLGYIDLYQIHWPNPLFSLVDSIQTIREFGVSAGVCNCSVDMLEIAKVDYMQIRYNPLDRWAELALIPYCISNGIKMIAYSPFGQDYKKFDGLFSLDDLSISGATKAQVILAWIQAKGLMPIPRTNNIGHVAEIAEVSQIELSDSDIGLIDNLELQL
jgi:diketogulonate reductase-like aldo/keto reductase